MGKNECLVCAFHTDPAFRWLLYLYQRFCVYFRTGYLLYCLFMPCMLNTCLCLPWFLGQFVTCFHGFSSRTYPWRTENASLLPTFLKRDHLKNCCISMERKHTCRHCYFKRLPIAGHRYTSWMTACTSSVLDPSGMPSMFLCQKSDRLRCQSVVSMRPRSCNHMYHTVKSMAHLLHWNTLEPMSTFQA